MKAKAGAATHPGSSVTRSLIIHPFSIPADFYSVSGGGGWLVPACKGEIGRETSEIKCQYHQM